MKANEATVKYIGKFQGRELWHARRQTLDHAFEYIGAGNSAMNAIKDLQRSIRGELKKTGTIPKV